MMKRYILISILFAAAVFSLSAQRVLTLDECRELAIQNNVAIRNSSLTTLAAKEIRKQAFTKYFPNISVNAIAFTTDKGVLQHDFSGSLPLPAIPGITEGGELDYNYDFSLIKKGIVAGATLVQPVYMGGEIVNGNKLAEVGEAVAELQARQSEDEVRQTVEQYYWQLAVLKAKRHTLDNVITLLDTLSYQVDVAVNAGVTLPNDLLEVQLRRNEMITDSIKLANGINIISTLLAQYIGLGVEPVDITENIAPEDSIALDGSIYLSPDDALYSTVDYRLLTKGVKAAELNQRMTLGANLPKVAIGAGYTESNLMSQWHGSASLFATVTIPITEWWGGSHAIKKSKLEVNVAKNNLEDASELLKVKMKNSWNDLCTSYRKIDVARMSIAQATENLRLNTIYYQAGTVTVTDLLKSQTLFRQSHDQYVEAAGQYHIDVTKYLIATGR